MKKILISLAIIICILCGCAQQEKLPDLSEESKTAQKIELKNNQYENLCVPTLLTKIKNDYFIVDCYHNQILVSEDVTKSIEEWKVLTDQINKGHTICSDGVVYLCDDTENNRILVFAKQGEEFYYLDAFDNIGKRPHFISYNEKNDSFYVLSSLTGEFYIFKRKKDTYEVYLDKCVQIPQLDGVYVRTFTFIDGLIYMPAGNGFIYEVDPDSFEILSFQALPNELGGPTQLIKIGDYYYMTVSTDRNVNPDFANLVRVKSPDDFIDGDYESIRDRFCNDGTPYVISEVDGIFYLAYHADDGKNCMWQFGADKAGEISNIKRSFE